MFVGEILGFAEIVGEIVELDGAVGVFADVQTDGFPLALSDGLLATLLMELPIEVIALGLLFLFASEGGSKGNAVEILGSLDAGEVAEGGQDVPPGGDMGAFRARFDHAGPPCDGGDANATLV